MSLLELIKTYAPQSAADGDWPAVASLLNDKSVVVRDSTPLTYARIRREFGDDIRAKVAGTLRAVAASAHPLAGEMADAHAVMLMENVGLEISSDERQAVIDMIAVAGGWSAEEASQIKSLGVRYTSIAEQAGYGEVTAGECQAAWQFEQERLAEEARQQEIRERVDALWTEWTAHLNERLNEPLATGDRAGLIAGLKASLALMEAV